MYRVNNIFYSLQGEGRNTGRAALFVRFAGCNLRCPFCDTEFKTFREISGEEILHELEMQTSSFFLPPSSLNPRPSTLVPQPSSLNPLVVLTGGEPTLQVDEAFVDLLHQQGYEVAMESNGTRQAPQNLDWLTVSPKGQPVVTNCSELKVVFHDAASVNDYGIRADYYYLQPCDTGDEGQSRTITAACVDYIKQHPRWRLSLQTHKLIHIE